jgi:hypothetical protein
VIKVPQTTEINAMIFKRNFFLEENFVTQVAGATTILREGSNTSLVMTSPHRYWLFKVPGGRALVLMPWGIVCSNARLTRKKSKCADCLRCFPRL